MSNRHKVKAREMQPQTTQVDRQPDDHKKPEVAAEDMAIEPRALDEEEVRLTAYFLWEHDGRPEGRDEHYWWAAVEKIARQKSSDALLQSNGNSA